MDIQTFNQSMRPNPYADKRVSYVGHGRLESAPETLSPLHVIAHELGHVQEFKGDAFRNGSEIRDVRVKINYELRDGRLIAVSGETSATTQKRTDVKPKDPSLEPYSDGKSFKDIYTNSKDDEKKAGKPEKPNQIEIIERDKKEELENKIKDLEVRLGSEKTKETAEGKDPKELTGKNERAREIASEKRRLEEEVRLLKMKEALKDSFDMLTDIRKVMISNIFGMMQVGNESKPGQLVNTLI